VGQLVAATFEVTIRKRHSRAARDLAFESRPRGTADQRAIEQGKQ
jgi:hypothetical protein